MDIILFIVFLQIGIFFYSIGIMQIIISLFCAIPLTRKTVAQCKRFVDTGGIYKSIAITITIWTLISAFVIWAIFKWGNSYTMTGFFIGIAISFLFSLKKWGINQANYQDYFSTFHRYYAQNDLEDLGIIEKESINEQI